MSHPRENLLGRSLRASLQTAPELEALAMVSMDGVEIASVLPQGVNTARLAAMSLAVFTLGEQIATDLQRERLEEVYIRGKHGFIIIIQIDKQAILAGLARAEARPGLVLLDMRRIANNLLATKREIQKKLKAVVPGQK